ncbi:methylmalonyl Co-A mutase-associated GTPase MeaB [Hansschlegelia quercus]|uniref:Methylmalonyl Co-A mutase-associated GTPase MeaB n=1 Tax=Hansschlegelia quercus TaxID=2528245 RepID=A0A4V2JED6_9HYPH|nr:methylmalonyl Co-A mutase-associated GTPase MeaB [Hansschlegelia quercus]TBN54846.1 methylmalonyl Co-A mutase-associated GTPase MeaB [Hansschlegelia quercus]
MQSSPRPALDLEDLAARIRRGERAALARAITLAESRRADHQADARALVQALLPETGKAIRVGVTGVPGVGKSTTIDALGSRLTTAGHKVAVLAVDPSSTRTGGSILGDKTRMARLALDRAAYVRPSPSAGTLGGVAAKTRESMLLLEAAGFDVILVETVGIGQSETAVADMTDVFLVLMLPGAGDELQGIKKGVIEVADIIAVNKADGDGATRAKDAAADYSAALRILSGAGGAWIPEVLTISGREDMRLDVLWDRVVACRDARERAGELKTRREKQQVRWMWTMVEARFRERLAEDPRLAARVPALERDVASGELAPTVAADEIAKVLGF